MALLLSGDWYWVADRLNRAGDSLACNKRNVGGGKEMLHAGA
jgi:hypothetical protein